MEQKAEKYIKSLYIDYGDLNYKAEKQIKQAFIDGMKEQLRIVEVVGRREQLVCDKCGKKQEGISCSCGRGIKWVK